MVPTKLQVGSRGVVTPGLKFPTRESAFASRSRTASANKRKTQATTASALSGCMSARWKSC